jgi:SH3 domain-containing YSC84-like protein 1
MKFHPYLSVPVVAALVVQVHAPVLAQGKQAVKVESAALTFQQFVIRSDKRIPPALLKRAQGIAIIPGVVQAGFFFGGRRGTGVLMMRNDQGEWGNPAFISLTGGSFGLQFGAQSSDVVLLFMDKSTVYKGLSRSFKLGGNVSVAAGPVGGDVVSPDDPRTQVYSYARNQGLFAGVALEGAKIAFDQTASDQYYGQSNLTPLQIFNNKQPLNPPQEVSNLKQVLDKAASASLPGRAMIASLIQKNNQP